MRNPKYLLLSCLAAFILVSCSKEVSIDSTAGSGSGNTEIGTWKFLDFHASTIRTIELSGGGLDGTKSVTYSDYTTIQNAGTLKFDGHNMTATGWTYTIKDSAIGYEYDNNVLIDSTKFPFSMTIPAFDAAYTYKKVGSDSLYFTSGGLINMGAGSTTNIQDPPGYKLEFVDDKMIMKVNFIETDTQTDQGITQKTTSQAAIEINLQRM